MEPYFNSTSGDAFDSLGFNDFLNAEDSSSQEEELLRKKHPEKSPHPAGDKYDFNMDFTKIKAPKKEKPKVFPEKTRQAAIPAIEEVPENNQSKSHFLKVLEAMQESEISISESESGRKPQEEEIKTEPFTFGNNPPISLTKKFELKSAPPGSESPGRTLPVKGKPPKVPESSQENDELKECVKSLEAIIELKQEQIYQLEKNELQNNFSEIQEEALETLKTQLRENGHQNQLLKIENEELNKQIEFTENRIKDLEVQNLTLGAENNRKDRAFEERLRLSESRTSTRAVREYERNLETDKEELLIQVSDLQLELAQLQQDHARANTERIELRSRLSQCKDRTVPTPFSFPPPEAPRRLAQTDENAPLLREIECQEALIRGYQKENEKLVQELKELALQSKEAQAKHSEENKGALIRDHGAMLVKHSASDIRAINELAGGTVISKEDYERMKQRVNSLGIELLQAQQRQSGLEATQLKELNQLQDQLRWHTQDQEARDKQLASLTQQLAHSRGLLEERPLEQPDRPATARAKNSLEQLRIKELEKQVESTKNYYIHKLGELRSQNPPSEDLKSLREALANKEQIIVGLQSRQAPQLGIFQLLGVPSGSIWVSICQELFQTSASAVAQDSECLVHSLDKLTDLLDSVPHTKQLTSFSALDSLLSKVIEISSSLNRGADWAKLQGLCTEAKDIAATETSRGLSGPPQVPVEEQEFWSDFSDEEYGVEDTEDAAALRAVGVLQGHVGALERSVHGWLPLASFTEMLREKVPLEFRLLEAFVRRLPLSGGRLDADLFLANLQEKPEYWWQQQLSNFSFERRNQVSKTGNSKSLVDSSTQGFLCRVIREKLLTYLTRENLEAELLVDQLFRGAPALSKRAFREQSLCLGLPLNREDTHILVKQLDVAHDGAIRPERFTQWMDSPPAPAQAWAAPTVTAEYKQLSDRDSQFLLLQAHKRIKELENNENSIQPPDRTLALKLTTIEEENSLLSTKLELTSYECDKLKLEKKRLENSVGTTELITLQRKIEGLESAHYRRELDLRGRVDALQFSSERVLEDLRRKHESEKSGLQKLLAHKNRQIEEFKTELDELLAEVEGLKRKSNC